MTDLVPIRGGQAKQVSLADLQNLLDARNEVAETRAPSTSTIKGRVQAAKKAFEASPLDTLMGIQNSARGLFDAFDSTIDEGSIPLSESQVKTLSDEYLHLEKLKVEIAALEERYRNLVFAHLDVTGPKIPGRPASQVPGRVEAEGPGPRIIFERRGGNRADPDLNTETLRGVLPPELSAQLYEKVHHDPIPAWDENVFNTARFTELVDKGLIDLDVVAEHLTPGPWRKPSFYKTRVDGDR